MKNEINDGGPAFPSHGSMGEVSQEGMSLRDYFAAKAMQGFMANDTMLTRYGIASQRENISPDTLMATAAYAAADAMLAAREGKA